MSDAPQTGGKGQPSIADTGTAGGEAVAHQLSAIARELQSYDDPEEVLTEIVAAAVEMIPGVDEGSISVVIGRRVSSTAPTSELARLVDVIQDEVQQGPCLDAAFVEQTVRVDDLATEKRWPLFAARANEAGAASMLSLQLFVQRGNLGALNLYSRTPRAFTDESEQIGLLFAAQAAIAYAGARSQAGLTAALTNRDVIGQAKGILMERHKITSDHAFLVLVRASQANNRKLHEVALDLVQTGALPRAAGTPPRAR